MKRKGKRTIVDTSQASEHEFVVEEIVDKRISKDGKTEYLLHWKDWPESERTWEPEEHLTCVELITKFEEKLKKSGSASGTNSSLKESSLDKSGTPHNKIGVNHGKSSSDAGNSMKSNGHAKKTPATQGLNYNEKIMDVLDETLIPEKVVGVINDDSGLLIIMKWKNKESRDLIPSQIVNEKWPQIVINYYQQRIRWRET